jgi:hypothetical protein
VDQRRKSAKAAFNNFNKLNLMRRLGNSGVLPENPRVGSSILSLGTSKINGLRIIPQPFVFFIKHFVQGLYKLFYLSIPSGLLVNKKHFDFIQTDPED